MISAETRVQVRHLFFAEHWKIGTIAHQLDIHPDQEHPRGARSLPAQTAFRVVVRLAAGDEKVRWTVSEISHTTSGSTEPPYPEPFRRT